MLGVGAGCGTTGPAGSLALYVSNSDSRYCCALLVRPAEL